VTRIRLHAIINSVIVVRLQELSLDLQCHATNLENNFQGSEGFIQKTTFVGEVGVAVSCTLSPSPLTELCVLGVFCSAL
jgi:hypothetical protein